MLYGSQKRFDKNGDGKLKGAEWQRWYQYAYGDEIEAKVGPFRIVSDHSRVLCTCPYSMTAP